MRLAGSDDADVFQNIWEHLRSDGIPDQAANHLTAEMMQHPSEDHIDSSVESFTRMFENFKSKGFNEHAAQAMAVEAMEGHSQHPKESLRFARLQDHASSQPPS